MEKETLLAFIARLAGNGSNGKASETLRELYTILKAQGVDHELTELVRQSASFVSDVREEARKDTFSEETLRIALRRAEDRRRREEEMRSYGRC